MNDPERLLDSGGPLERALLETASRDAGSDAAYRRVQQAIGVATALGTAGTSGAASGSALGAGKLKAGTSVLFGKWLIIGATAGTVTAGATAYVASRAQVSAPEHKPLAAARAPAPLVVRAPPSAPMESTGSIAETQPSIGRRGDDSPAAQAPLVRTRRDAVPAVTDSREVPAPEPRTPAPPAKTLSDEVNLVDTARAALAQNDPQGALAVLSRYRAEFPAGTLRLEVAVLSVRALLGAGRVAEAEREASGVLAAHPSGPYAERVRALLEGRVAPQKKP